MAKRVVQMRLAVDLVAAVDAAAARAGQSRTTFVERALAARLERPVSEVAVEEAVAELSRAPAAPARQVRAHAATCRCAVCEAAR